MKRIFSLILAACLLFSAASVFAAGDDKVFEALGNTVYSGEFEMSFKTELNKPLLIAELLEESMFGNTADSPVDFKMLLEGILTSEINAEGAYNMSEDYKKADIYISYTISNPININESLKIAAWSKWDIWMQYDFKSETPVYRMIYKMPFSKQYIVMDMSEQLKEAPLALADTMPDEESMSALEEKIITLYKENADVSSAGGTYNMKIDDMGFKNIFIGIFDIISELMNEQYLKMGMAPEDIEAANEGFDLISESLSGSKDKFAILGNDGISVDMKINPLGFITESKSSIHVALNIYDIMQSLDAAESCEQLGITKENSDIDFTVYVNENISKHNENVEVQYPELTAENSYDIMSEIAVDNTNYYSLKYKNFTVKEEGTPFIENGTVYVNLKDISDQCGFDFSYTDQKAYVDTKTSLGTAEFTVGSNTLTRGSEVFSLDTEPVEKNGEVYVSALSLSYINIQVDETYYDNTSGSTYIYCFFEDPDIEVPETNTEVYVEAVPEPPLYFTVYSDEVPQITDDGAIYVPFYPLIGKFNVGTEEIHISDGEILVESEKAFGFNNLKLYENSVLTEKDGEKILIENPVLNIDGDYWVGTDFAENVLGYDFTGMSYNIYDTFYNFEMQQ